MFSKKQKEMTILMKKDIFGNYLSTKKENEMRFTMNEIFIIALRFLNYGHAPTNAWYFVLISRS